MSRSVVESILEGFFGQHNDVSTDDAWPFVEQFETTNSALLPYRRGTSLRWYGFSTDARRARDLQNEAMAFVGPSRSGWTGPAAELDLADPVEGMLAAVARGPVLRIEPLPGREKELTDAITLMAEVLSQRPEPAARVPRPRHRILSELELAFAVRNAPRAAGLIEEVAATGTLGAINLLFLKIRLHDASGNASAVLADPDLPDLLRRRRPRAVTQVIARAVQTLYLAPFEEEWRDAGGSQAASSALNAFGDLSAEFQSVFADPAVRSDDSFLAPIVAHHLLRGETDEAVAAVDDAPPARQGWLRALIDAAVPSEQLQGAAQAPSAVVEDVPVESQLRQAFEKGDYAGLLDIARRTPADAVLVDYVVRGAYNLDTLAAAQEALGLLASADARVVEDARRDRSFRDAETALREYMPPVEGGDSAPAVSSWQDWFELVARVPNWRGSLAVAERGRFEWPSTQIGSASERERLASAIVSCANEAGAHAAALGGLVYLIDWLDEFGAETDVVDVLAAALDLLVYAADNSDDRDNLSIRLFGALAAAKPDIGKVGARLRDFADLWSEVAAPRRLDWPLALLDVAIDFFGRTSEVQSFFGTVLASAALWPERLDRSHILALTSIATDLGELEALIGVLGEQQDEPDDDPLQALGGLEIGIYTLTPGAGTRVIRTLSERCPDAVVQVNADLVSTEQLRALAQRADVMVVSFQSAKHAATDAIVAARGRSRVVPARGKGSAGILRSLEDWAAKAPT
jgi:hypothetical protein